MTAPSIADVLTRGRGADRRSDVVARARPPGFQPPPPRLRGAPQPRAVKTTAPLWERAFLLGALLAQQDAFLNLARIARGADSADPNGEIAATDPLNSALVFLTLVGLAALTVLHRRAVWEAVRRNGLSLALVGLALLSAVWSVDPGLTVKRTVVYSATVGLPLYMAARLGFDGALRLAAASFAVAAGASLVVGLAAPSIGVMHFPGLEGTWRGVFSHKNALAQSMLMGALLEAGLVALGPRRLRHAAVLGIELLLILLSRSVAGIVVAAAGLLAMGAYLGLRRGGQVRRLLTFAGPLLFAVAAAVIVFLPTAVQQASGKDATLTGRTELWAGVLQALAERPLTGWGFQAFWQPENRRAQEIWEQIGWIAPNGHNGLLDVALGLGPLGFLLTLAIVLQAFVRGGRLFGAARGRGEPSLATAGAATLVVLAAILVGGVTEATLARPGSVDWLVLNLMSFMAVQLWGEVRPPGAPLSAGAARPRQTAQLSAAGGRPGDAHARVPS